MTLLVGRNARDRLAELRETFRIVIVQGARQTGKTTLLRELAEPHPVEFVSLDDDAARVRAVTDPMGFVSGLPTGACVDEYQRGGEPFLLAVKHRADRSRERGQLLLTGSTSYLAARSVTETLAGRTGRLVLWPLSHGERLGTVETFVDRLFHPEAWPPEAGSPTSRNDAMDLVLEGGFPEIVTEHLSPRLRNGWFETLVGDVISREALRPLAELRLEDELRTVFRLLCARTAQELVISGLARDARLDRRTAANYVTLLEALFMVHLLPAWGTSATTRAKRRPKIHIVDTGLAAWTAGVGPRDLSAIASGEMAGALFESFVVNEIRKQATWSDISVNLAHFRDRNGNEVDLIIEDRATGQIAGIEVKATSTPRLRHVAGLQRIRAALGDRFVLGLLLHTGANTLPMGEGVWAVPMSTLWRSD
jgi:uncharacterized protein